VIKPISAERFNEIRQTLKATETEIEYMSHVLRQLVFDPDFVKELTEKDHADAIGRVSIEERVYDRLNNLLSYRMIVINGIDNEDE